jgi:hypothetical protein
MLHKFLVFWSLLFLLNKRQQIHSSQPVNIHKSETNMLMWQTKIGDNQIHFLQEVQNSSTKQ